MSKAPKRRSAATVVAILSTGLFISVVSNALLLTVASRTKQIPIAVDDKLRIMRPALLDQVNVSDARVLEFAEEALRASFSHDFVNHIGTLNYAKRFYTTQGGRMLQEQLEPILDEMRKERAVMSAGTEAPLMVRSAHLFHGRVAWQVEIPITIRFQGQRASYSPRLRVARILVVQVPPEEHTRGISVHTIQLEPRRAAS
ncbi:DotI/IcmL family type IV secretion protein [Achromobacter sp. DH1f]|uniref:DotI/IcmL family type IV secretion protein n=1 Tax=Achromobacter sp. DH1f TaxID=1397275 RepID=UPI000467F780|nr:DotI/IcmL family type IV secretion protein [Achromobacter sp. DH1f]